MPSATSTSSSIDRDQKRILSAVEIIGADAPSRARKEIRAGDVLVSTVRPNLNAVAMVPEELDGNIASTGFCVLRPSEETILGRFLFYYCRTGAFVNALVANVRGAQYPAVSDSDIKAVDIPLPPLPEQRRIVEILDQADRLRRLRAEADAGAERILPALFIQMFGSPASWAIHPQAEPLGRLVKVISGATPSKNEGRFWGGEVPWVSPKDMKRDFLDDSEDHVSTSALDETNLKTVSPDSVLIVVRGMILAHSVPVALAKRPLTINQDMKALVPSDRRLSGSVLWAALKVARGSLLARVRFAAHGTRKLDTPELLELPVVVPDQGQRRAVDQAVCWLTGSAALRQSRSRKLETLFSLLLHRAFEGKLTASWREAHMKELLGEMEQQAMALREIR